MVSDVLLLSYWPKIGLSLTGEAGQASAYLYSETRTYKGGFGAWRLNLAFSPRVKVARFRPRAGGGGRAWVALSRAFPQTQGISFLSRSP